MLRFFLLMTAVLIFSPPSRHTIQIISSHPQTTTIVPEGKTFQTFLSEIDLRVWGYISGSWFGIDGPPFTETCSHGKLFYYLSLPCQCTFFPCWFLTCQSYLKHISRHPTSGPAEQRFQHQPDLNITSSVFLQDFNNYILESHKILTRFKYYAFLFLFSSLVLLSVEQS